MKTNYLQTEEDIKKQLHIKDFRSLKKKQLIKFFSELPNMDAEVAMKCIEQFPKFSECTMEIVEDYRKLCETAMKDSYKNTIEADLMLLDTLNERLKNSENLSEEDYRFTFDMMLELRNHMERLEDKKTQFAFAVLRLFGILSGGALMILAIMLGGNASIPMNKKDEDEEEESQFTS